MPQIDDVKVSFWGQSFHVLQKRANLPFFLDLAGLPVILVELVEFK